MNKKGVIIIFLLLCGMEGFSQKEDEFIQQGNLLYKEGKFEEAIPFYKKALGTNSSNLKAIYNLSAALSKTGKHEEAQQGFETIAKNSKDAALTQKSYFNKGVTLTQQKKLEESIEAYKKALSLDPSDEDSRFNLQKALEELRKKKEPEKKKQPDKKDKKQEPQQTPPANKKQMEQWLQSLKQKEQEVQQKMQQNRSRANKQPEKDW